MKYIILPMTNLFTGKNMKKIIPFVLVSAALLSRELPAYAREDNPPIINGQPCIEEVCLGDEVQNLSHIQWKKLSAGEIDQPQRIKAIGDTNAIKTFSRYLTKIDGTGLQALTKIKGFCVNPIHERLYRLQAEYVNKKGQKIIVNFIINPTEDGKSQKYIVSDIIKIIPVENITSEQRTSIVSQVEEKYLGMATSRFPKVSVMGNTNGVGIVFNSYLASSTLPYDTYMKFPGCGGDKKIKI